MSKKWWIGAMLVGIVMAAASALMLWHLGAEPLQDYDEATYAEVVREAFANHNFLSFTFGGATFVKKPPLMFWLMGASEEMFGQNAFAMRLPEAIAGIATAGLVMAIAWEVAGSAVLAALAGAILLTTAPFLETARQVRTDIFVVLFIMAAVWAFLRGLKDERWFVLFGALAGLAVLSKSVIAVFAFVAAATIIILWQRFDVLKSKWLWYGAGAFLLVAAPWHLYETAQFGFAFWKQYIGVEVVARTQENLFWTVSITNGQLVRYLFQFCEPWISIFFAAAVFAAARFWKSGNRRAGFVLACTVSLASVMVVFFAAATKAPTYLLPAYPFAALGIALSVPELRARWAQNMAGALAAALVLYAGVLAVYNAYHFNPYYATYLALARDEEVVGERIGALLPQGQPWYVYDDENLSDIMYYSGNLETRLLAPGEAVPHGALVVMNSNAFAQFQRTFSELRAIELYRGSQVTLVKAE
ncbi:MAG: ArnT family glycosyltransferase [Minisyncoccia bacterium]